MLLVPGPHFGLADLQHLFQPHVPTVLWFYDKVTTVNSWGWGDVPGGLGKGRQKQELEGLPLQGVPSSASYMYPLRQ